MKITKTAIENHQFTNIIILMLVLLGLVSLLTMPRSEDPQVSPSGSSVVVIYPGANPNDLEQLVTDRIEEVVNELDDIKEIESYIESGISVTHIEFFLDTDPDEKYSEVIQKVNSIRNELPGDILELIMRKWEISDVNILQLALVSEEAPYSRLEFEAEQLKNKLERVSGVKRAKLWAFPEREVRVSMNMSRMAHMRISLNQLYQSISSANMNIPGGTIDAGSKRFSIQTSGNYQSIDDIKNTIIHSSGTKIVYLKDIANVQFNYEDETYHARYNQRRAIYLTVNQKEGTNIFDIMSGMNKNIEQFRDQLPANMELYHVFDQSVSVSNRINDFFKNLIEGIVLVGIVIFFALSIRAAVIVMLAIPISIMIGIGFVDFSGYGIEQMSIAGLVVVLGILVDNAIVVTENISRYLKSGHSRIESAIRGTSEIAWPVVSATITTVLAFVPMMMIGDVTGDFIRSMPVTVVYTLVASLFIALTLTPYLSKNFLTLESVAHVGRFQSLLTGIIESPYRKTLKYALSHRKLVIGLSLIIFTGSLALFPLVGISFFPKAEKPQFFINITAPEGTSLDETNAISRDVEQELALREEIEVMASNIGRSNPRVYYNVIERDIRSNEAQIFVQVKEDKFKSMPDLITDLRSKFEKYAGAEIEIKELEQGPPIEAPIAIKILGDNLDMLKKIAADVEGMIASTEGTINIDNPLRTSKIDLSIDIHRAKAGMLGVPLAEIDRTVRAAMTGLNVSTYRDDNGKEFDIVLRLPIDDKTTIDDFDKIYITSVTGAQIPLRQLADIKFSASPQKISHYNLERSVMVTADMLTDYSVNEATQEVIRKLDNYDWPKGYRYFVGGELESRQESFGGMLQAILIAILGILGVLVLQFKSYKQPLIVFSAIPLAMIGSIITLFVTGYTFSFTAFVGLTSLVGIVVNNSIILVDYTNQLRGKGKSMDQALMEAGETRFTPIILTTATTIGGLLPLTLQGGTLWAPMGWTIIGGLMTSTFLTLVFVPVLYKIVGRDK